jgi:hypothetical protein
VDATGNYGLAAFVVDIHTNTGVPQGVGEQQVFGSSSVTAFARDEGLTNPDDMGGTSHEDDLIQAGGAQNTIEHTGSGASQALSRISASASVSMAAMRSSCVAMACCPKVALA